MSFLDEIYNESTEVILNETFQVLNEVNKVQFDKQTLKRRLLSQAELICAKEAGSPVYDKYIKATIIRRKCRDIIHAQFANKAKVKVKEWLKNRKTSPSATPTTSTTPKED